MLEKKTRVHIFVFGRAQGVCFRAMTQLKAKALGLVGWVKNLSDGRVEAIFEGKKENIEKMLKWLRRGPILARVDKLDFQFESYQGEFKDFEIRN